MRPGFFTLIFILLVIGDLLWWLWADRRLRPMRQAMWWRSMLAAFVVTMAAYVVAAVMFPSYARRSSGPIPLPLHAAGYLWHLIILPLTGIVLLIGAIVRLPFRIARWVRPVHQPSQAEEVTTENEVSVTERHPPPTRRQILAAATTAVSPVLVSALAGVSVYELGRLRVRKFNLSFPQLPPALDGLTLAQVTDIHVGKFTRDGYLPALVEAVNQLRADFVVVTGDIIDLALSDLPIALDTIRKFDPRHGLLLCEGNHDLIENGLAFERRVLNAGFPLLLDDEQMINLRGEAVRFLGIRYRVGGTQRSIDRVAPMAGPDAFPILLAHHPHAFDPAAAAGLPLTLAGHTHGGQLMLNERLGMGPVMFRYWSGLYQKANSKLIVSNGVGAWFPLRVHAPAEIVHITLRASRPA